MNICGRCKECEGTIIHTRYRRKDGTYRISYYCRPCQSERNRVLSFRKQQKTIDFTYSVDKAMERYKYLSRKYANV